MPRPASRLSTPAPSPVPASRWMQLRQLAAHPEFRRGWRDESRVLPGMAVWAVVTGVAMVKGGLSVPLAVLMSLTVFSAGAQIGAVALMAGAAPLWVIVAATFCLNLRFIIFSAALRPYVIHLPRARRMLLGYACADLSYVVFMQRHGNHPPGQPGQAEYLAGCCAVNWLAWQACILPGIVLADHIPTDWGLGFAGVLALLGLSCTLVLDRACAVAAVVAGLTAVAAYALPLHLNIVVAILAAIATGLLAERLQGGRPPQGAA